MARNRTTRSTRRTNDSRYWYVIFGYVVGLPLLFILSQTVFQGNPIRTVGISTILSIFVLAAGVGVYPALFQDSMYLRRTAYAWEPAWWYYLGAPLAVTAGAYMLADYLPEFPSAFGPMVMMLYLAGYVMSVVYIWRRHQHVGIP